MIDNVLMLVDYLLSILKKSKWLLKYWQPFFLIQLECMKKQQTPKLQQCFRIILSFVQYKTLQSQIKAHYRSYPISIQQMLKTAAKQYKFVLVGDSAVGKSSLLNRFVDKVYTESFLSTIGVDFKFKRVRIDNNEVKLQIWDTAGQQTFRSIVSAYYTSADAIIIVYDITSYDSFQNIKSYWIEQAENNNKNDAKIFLIGNKIDEESRRQVEKFTLDSFVEEHSISGTYEASAKTGQSVEQAFIDIAKNLYFGIQQKPLGTQQMRGSKSGIEIKANRKSMIEQLSEQKRQDKPDQYQEVISVNEEVREEKVQKKQKQERIKINQGNTSKPKPKNPNYNKSCCLK